MGGIAPENLRAGGHRIGPQANASRGLFGVTGPTWKILEYRGREGLRRLEEDWRDLCQAMPLRTVFHACQTHVTYLELLMAAPEKYRCLAMSDGRRVRAICPLEARWDRVFGLSIPVWGVPLHPHIQLSDVICPEDEARRQLVPALLDHLRHKSEGRPLLVLGPLPADSVLWDGLRQLPPWNRNTRETMPADVFDCDQPIDVLMGRLSKHFRRNLRAHRRKLEALDDVRFVRAVDPDEVAAELEMFVRLEAAGWKGESGTGSAILLHDELLAFYRGLASTLGEAGAHDRCEINSLYVDERCIASQLCFRTGEVLSLPKIAYDEEYARLSPGLLLLQETLEQCCNAEGVKCVNLQTDGSWQRDWRPDVIAMRQAHLLIGNWTGRAGMILVRCRFGWGRRMAHWVRRQREGWALRRSERDCARARGNKG